MPASFATTARNALRYMLGTDLVSDIDEGFQKLAEDVDTKMLSYWTDTFAKRPPAGQPNRIFRASDTGAYYIDTGSEWLVLPVLVTDTAAKRPAAGRPGRVFEATDKGTLALDLGGAWLPILTASSSWQGRTARALGTAYTPNATRPTEVALDVSLSPTPGFGKAAQIYVNGALHSELFEGGQATPESGVRKYVSFILPAGQTWEVRDGTGTGGVGGLFSNYLPL